MMQLPERPRRNRRTSAIRGLVRETSLQASQLIYPLFIHSGADNQPIDAMPGQQRWSLDGLVREVERAHKLGINAVVLFPKVAEALKSSTAEASYDDDGLVPQAIRKLKDALPDVAVITDVALDPYNSDGHDGIVSPQGIVLNDETVEVLCKQALCHAAAGADIISPSDMMDGRVLAIREALDDSDYTGVSILAYTAKYASAYYGPFRGALDSAPREGAHIPADKQTYQMDPANAREALRETELDVAEGADIIMVKPAGPYLDVIYRVRQHTHLPVAAYQVSGEYVMIKTAAAAGYLDEKKLAMESLIGIRRAGADMILTYFAPQVAQWLQQA